MEASAINFTSFYAKPYSKKSLSSSTTLLRRSDIYLQRLKSNVYLHPSLSLRHKAFQLVASYGTEFSRGLETAGISIHSTNTVMAARTKFQLHKKCHFGEHFLLVGNEPVIGMWNPSKAIPLNWSHGNIWTTEIFIKVDSPIQYKLILKQSSGDIVWQPGPDRIFRAWKTNNRIIVIEDWENASLQKITEEKANNHNAELLVTHDRQPTDAENIRRIREELKLMAKKGAKFSESTTRTGNDFIVGEKTKYSTEGPWTNAHMGVSIAGGYEKEAPIYKNKPRTSRRKFLLSMEDGDLGIHEEGFVLVPGLKQIVS
nr:uncharacterized protein LOC107410814 [Ziziphus jujuba var. spinosa]